MTSKSSDPGLGRGVLSPEDESVVFAGRLTGVWGDDRGSCCSDDPEMRWESRGADAGGGSRQGEKREKTDRHPGGQVGARPRTDRGA